LEARNITAEETWGF